MQSCNVQKSSLQLGIYTQALYNGFAFRLVNDNADIEKNVQGEGYENCTECDLNGDGKITSAEAWRRYIDNIQLYPKVTKSLQEQTDFRYPLKTSDGLTNYTRKLMANAKSDTQKVKILIDAILLKNTYNKGTKNEVKGLGVLYSLLSPRPNGLKNATEVFEKIDYMDYYRSAQCAEYSSLFVTMARIAGLKAGFKEVLVDYSGMNLELLNSRHACACVDIDGKQVLVDLTAGPLAFDIKHKKVAELSDTDFVSESYLVSMSFYRKDGETEKAEEAAKTAVEIDPDYASARDNLMVIYIDEKNLDLAEQEAKRGIKLAPSSAKAHSDLGCAYTLEGKFELAEIELKKALEIDPKLGKTHLRLGRLYEAWGKYGVAVTELKKAIEVNGKNAKSAFDSYYAVKDYGPFTIKIDEGVVVTHFELALNNDEAHVNLAEIFIKQGKYEDALAELKLALDINPGLAAAYLTIGKVCLLQKKLDLAEIALNKAAALAPKEAVPHLFLGVLRQAQGFPEKAEEELKKAVELDPKLYDAHKILAEMYAAQKKLDPAIAEYRAMLNLKPKEYNLYWKLFVLYLRKIL